MVDSSHHIQRLLRLSPYRSQIIRLADRLPKIMENNNQLRPLWHRWISQDTNALQPQQVFSSDEIKILRSFFEYLYFASNSFKSTMKIP